MSLRSRCQLCVALALLAGGCAGSREAAPVLVGHVATLTGADREHGEQAARGIRLAVKEADQGAGGDGPPPIKVLHADAKGDPQAFEAEVVRLAAVNRVAALLGGATADQVERLDRGLVLVSPCGTRTRPMSEFVFLTGLTPAARGQALARFALRQQVVAGLAASLAALAAPGGLALVQTPCALTSDSALSSGVVIIVDERREHSLRVADAFGKTLTAAGVGPVRRWRCKVDAADLKELPPLVQKGRPSAVLVAGDAAAVWQLRHVLPEVPFFFADAEDGLHPPHYRPDLAGGVYTVTPFVTDSDAPRARAFTEKYRTAFHEDPDAAAALAYEGAGILFAALRQSGEAADRAALRVNLGKLHDFPGLYGPLTFDAEQTLSRPAFVVFLSAGRTRTVGRIEPPESSAR
jgi:branched-chain amino acid transport system substrate-binding protein